MLSKCLLFLGYPVAGADATGAFTAASWRAAKERRLKTMRYVRALRGLLALILLLALAGPARAEEAKAPPGTLFQLALHDPDVGLLAASPGFAFGSDESLCQNYGFCVYALPDPQSRGLQYLTVTVADHEIIMVEAAANISMLENPPCDAYAALIGRYGPPVEQAISKAFMASKKASFASGRGFVATPYDPARFGYECAQCALRNTGRTAFLLDLRFAGGLRTVITPDAISYTLGDEAQAAQALLRARERRDADADEHCRERRQGAATCLDRVGAQPN